MLRRHALVSLVAGVALFVGAPARADDSAREPSALEALDTVLPRVVEQVGKSVVTLEIQERDAIPVRPLSEQQRQALGLNLFRSFDERYFRRPRAPVTGVVVKSDAKEGVLIASSAWNLLGVKKLVAVDPTSGERREAKVLGHDENLDVAVVRVAGVAWPALTPASETRSGAMAVLVARAATGLPVATFGHVSAIGRYRGDALQVTTRMSYGNLGGAVVDLDGRLLGIAAHMTERTFNGQSSGVGFSAPVARVLQSLDTLAAGKVITKRPSPFLGVQLDMKEVEGHPGIRIAKVFPNTPAAKAGLADGDIVKIFHGAELKELGQIREELDRLEVGEKIIVTIYRPSKDAERDFTIELAARPKGNE